MKLQSATTLVGALVLAAGLVLGGVAVGSGLRSLGDRDRTVDVRGLAEREVEADRVVWPIVFKTVGQDLAQVNASVADANTNIRDFLLRNGVAEGDITVSAPEVKDLWTNEWNSTRPVDRYNATSVVTVASGNVALVRQLMLRTGELLDKGIALAPNDYDHNIEYSFTGLNEIKPAMIEEATRNARAAAEKFAQDSESRLGKIKTAQQGLFSIDDRDPNTPFIKRVRVVTTITYYLAN